MRCFVVLVGSFLGKARQEDRVMLYSWAQLDDSSIAVLALDVLHDQVLTSRETVSEM